MFNLPSSMSVPLRRFKMEGIQVSLLMVCKSPLVLVLLQGAMVQGEPGVDFVLTQSGINRFANDTVKEVLKDIMKRVSVNPRYSLTPTDYYISLWNIKLLDMKTQAPVVTMEPGKGMKVEISETSLRMTCSWVYESRARPKLIDKGSASTAIKGLKVSMSIEVADDGMPVVTECKASIGQFRPFFGRNSLLNQIVENTIGDQLESTFEQVTCEAVLASANYIIAKKLDFLTNLTFEHGPLKLNYHLNKTVTVDQDAIRVHLNGRFDGDSGDLKFIEMDLPVEGMVGFAVSEEVVNSALRVWHKGTSAEFSFVVDARKCEHPIHKDLLKVDETLLIKISLPIHPNVSISSNGIVASLIGSAELRLNNPKPGSNRSVKVTFSASAFFDLSLTRSYQDLRSALKDFELNALYSPEPDFGLEEFDKLFACLRMVYLRDRFREEFVLLIPLFHEPCLKSAQVTVNDKFFQVAGELANF